MFNALTLRKLTAATALLWSFGSATAETTDETINRYLITARAVVSELSTNNVSPDFVMESIDSLLEDAKPVLLAFAAKHTQCVAQLNRLIELYPEINVWTPLQIRENIEGAAALPRGRGCYPARDTVAHPAIVRALARAGIAPEIQPRLIAEMNEAIGHMEEIRLDLNQ